MAHETEAQIREQLDMLENLELPYLLVGNKSDALKPDLKAALKDQELIMISAKHKTHLDELRERLKAFVQVPQQSQTVVTNARHLQSLERTQQALNRTEEAIGAGISGDLLAQDIREALYHLGEITGEVTPDDLLGNIFSKFCIGK
jgi:tRNA modification GTPase